MDEALAQLQLKSRTVTLRRARRADVPALVALLAADPVAQAREELADGDLAAYYAAFDMIDADPRETLVVADSGGEVVATLQLSILAGLARRGATRGQIEAVRVREDLRDQGLGASMIRWAIDEAQRRGCSLVQLTSDNVRRDAHRFYERLGFVASHTGFKLSVAH